MQKSKMLEQHTGGLKTMLSEKTQMINELEEQFRHQSQELLQMKRVIAEMQVAKGALEEEHRYELRSVQDEHVHKEGLLKQEHIAKTQGLGNLIKK